MGSMCLLSHVALFLREFFNKIGQLQSLHKKCIRPLYLVASEYDDVWKNHEQSVKQHNELVAVNVELREERLEKKECVR